MSWGRRNRYRYSKPRWTIWWTGRDGIEDCTTVEADFSDGACMKAAQIAAQRDLGLSKPASKQMALSWLPLMRTDSLEAIREDQERRAEAEAQRRVTDRILAAAAAAEALVDEVEVRPLSSCGGDVEGG